MSMVFEVCAAVGRERERLAGDADFSENGRRFTNIPTRCTLRKKAFFLRIRNMFLIQRHFKRLVR